MSHLNPKKFPVLPGVSNSSPAQPQKVKKQWPSTSTYNKPPKTNGELLPRSTNRYAIAINTLNHSFSDINSQNENAHRFEQSFSDFALLVSEFYSTQGACSIQPRQKAGWVEIGFLNKKFRDQALSTPFTHENQNFQPLRAYSKYETLMKVSFENIPVDEEIGMGKQLEDRLRSFLEKYGEVPSVTHLLAYPECPGIYRSKAIATLIPNENVVLKKEDEHPGSIKIPRSFAIFDFYEIDVKLEYYNH